jgi:hypothetical protein
MSAATITEFLTARLDEDEAAAKAAGPVVMDSSGPGSEFRPVNLGEWHVGVEGNIAGPLGGYIAVGPYGSGIEETDAAHIVRHDPARVLREVEAGRQLLSAYEDAVDWLSAAEDDDSDIFSDDERPAKVQWHGGVVEALTAALAIRAAVWRDHPDYSPAWSPIETMRR